MRPLPGRGQPRGGRYVLCAAEDNPAAAAASVLCPAEDTLARRVVGRADDNPGADVGAAVGAGSGEAVVGAADDHPRAAADLRDRFVKESGKSRRR
jgi:hypothetical protein